MELDLYQIDAFITDAKGFSGNPAAVIPLSEWINDWVMQAIAAENNLSETAFFVKQAFTFTTSKLLIFRFCCGRIQGQLTRHARVI